MLRRQKIMTAAELAELDLRDGEPADEHSSSTWSSVHTQRRGNGPTLLAKLKPIQEPFQYARLTHF